MYSPWFRHAVSVDRQRISGCATLAARIHDGYWPETGSFSVDVTCRYSSRTIDLCIPHFRHIAGALPAARCSPAGADKVDHIRHLLVIRRQPNEGMVRLETAFFTAGVVRVEDDVDERRRIFGLHNRVALQRREGALVTHAIGTVAGRAVIDVQRRAGFTVIALPQILRHAVFYRRGGLFSCAAAATSDSGQWR